ANAYAVDDQARNGAFHFTAGTLASSTVSSGYCSSQQDNWQALGPFITESAANFERDGHGNTLCVLVSNRLATVRDGATIFYRVIAVVSPGSNGVLDVDTTNFATTGVLSFDSEEGAIDDT